MYGRLRRWKNLRFFSLRISDVILFSGRCSAFQTISRFLDVIPLFIFRSNVISLDIFLVDF